MSVIEFEAEKEELSYGRDRISPNLRVALRVKISVAGTV